MQLLLQRMADHAIACEWQPGYLSLSVKAARSRALQRWMDHVSGAYGYPLRWIAPADIGGWIASDRYDAGVYDARSGHLHPLKYCLGLACAAQQAGVRVYESSAVLAMRHGPRALLQTALGSVSCRHAILAGNVYLAEYGADVAPQVSGRIMPVGTYMIATEPMAPERALALMPERTAASDTNHLLDYFRVSADHRVLFGGGDSFSKTLPRNLIERIRRNMLRVFPQLGDVHVAHAWGGFVDVTMNLAPDFGRLAPNVYYVQGFSGHGVAMAGMAGKLVAEAVAAQAERFDLFARIRHRRFPGGTLLRTPALALGMWYYRLRDAL
jgi:gamma-glutamylputrescine oxidase